MFINFNGQTIKEEDYKISAKSMGLLYGYGLFETIIILKGKPCFFREHIERLRKGSKTLDMLIPYEDKEFFEYTDDLLQKNQTQEGSLRLNCYKTETGHDILMQITKGIKYKEEDRKKGVSLCISDIRRNSLSPICNLKSFNYMENILAKKEAQNKGYDEALFLNEKELICEGAVSNIFFINQGKVFTPKESCGLLPGITRAFILKLCKELQTEAIIGEYKIQELYCAQEIFITNSLMGVMPINKLEDKNLHIEEYKITKLISQKYNELLESEIKNA